VPRARSSSSCKRPADPQRDTAGIAGGRRPSALLLCLVALAGCGGTKHKDQPATDALAQALAYVPTESPYVIALATDPDHGQGAAARNLLERFAGADIAVAQAQGRIQQALGLPPNTDLGPLLGNDLVATRTSDGALVVWVVKDEDALRAIVRERRPSANMRVVVKGSLLLAGEPAAVTRALSTRARHAGMTRRLFEERLRGLPADSLLRVEGNAALIPPAQESKFAWVRSLNRLALTVRADGSGLHARVRAASGPNAVGDLPLAPGATPPTPLYRANGATAGIRDLRHVIRFGLRALKASDPGTYRRYDVARRGLKLLRRGDIDRDVIDQLGGIATVWTPDLKTFTITAPVADPERMAKALSGLSPLMSRLLDAAGLPGARYGVAGRTFVVTTDQGTSLAGLAAGSPRRIGSLTGALTGVVRGRTLGQAIIDRLGLPPIASLALGALGDTTFAVRTATSGVEASADLSIR
jgi:hypothetical protein